MNFSVAVYFRFSVGVGVCVLWVSEIDFSMPEYRSLREIDFAMPERF